MSDVERIAVIGMAGRFPGAASPHELWDNVAAGVESIVFGERLPGASPRYVPASPVLDGLEDIDAELFGMTPREAALTDPQHRLFLECSWACLEDAGYQPSAFDGRIGVFGGVGMPSYLLLNLVPDPEVWGGQGGYPAQILHGNDKDHASTRVAYRLGLTGPAVTVQTACSTSLVAVATAAQALLDGQCDIALAGGASVKLPNHAGYHYEVGGIFSPDGHCRAFDADAAGTVFGSGAGVVALKRLTDAVADGDAIRAVILAVTTNNDGAVKAGYAAPSVEGQAEVIADALAVAGVDARSIGYVEAHGTGTAVGDPIEIAALTDAFRRTTNATEFCPIGTVKANIGHLNAAAGVTGLIKAVLALEHRLIPPSLNFRTPNPHIDFARTPFYVPTEPCPWPAGDTPRRAGVSSFGVGGTNAHAILEEAPAAPPTAPSQRAQLLLLSARSPSALDSATTALAQALRGRDDAELADVAHTLRAGRRAFGHRRIVVAGTCAQAVDALERGGPHAPSALHDGADTPVAFLFPGQGAQYAGMAGGLYASEPAFRAAMDRCAERLAGELEVDVRDAATASLTRTSVAQPAIFAVEYALAQLWRSVGVEPVAMLGHSVGEWVAACLAGVFTLEDALRLVAARGRLMQALPAGAMLAVRLGEDEARTVLGEHLDLAAVNGPTSCTLSGPTAAIERAQRELEARGVPVTRLRTSHAFHSRVLEPMLEPFARLVAGAAREAPRVPFLSGVAGTWITEEQATDPGYWARQARGTVRFADGLDALTGAIDAALIEVGPGRALSGLARRSGLACAHSLPAEGDAGPATAVWMRAVGAAWLAGVPVDWQALSTGEPRRRVPLPPYPFERGRHWIDPPGDASARPAPEAAPPADAHVPTGPPDVIGAIRGIWEQLFGLSDIDIEQDFFELGGDSLLATQLVSRIRGAFAVELPLDRLLDATTIARMADLVQDLASGEPEKPAHTR